MALEIVPEGFTVWRGSPPPISTWVWMLYKADDKPQLVLTCKRGCCVYDYFGALVLPAYWRLATPEEGEAMKAKWDQITPITRASSWAAIRAALALAIPTNHIRRHREPRHRPT